MSLSNDIMWIAGVLEGDGYFGAQGAGVGTKLKMKNLEVVNHFGKLWNRSVYLARKNQNMKIRSKFGFQVQQGLFLVIVSFHICLVEESKLFLI